MALTAIHPGEPLAEELEALDMSSAELARKIDVPTNRVTRTDKTNSRFLPTGSPGTEGLRVGRSAVPTKKPGRKKARLCRNDNVEAKAKAREILRLRPAPAEKRREREKRGAPLRMTGAGSGNGGTKGKGKNKNSRRDASGTKGTGERKGKDKRDSTTPSPARRTSAFAKATADETAGNKKRAGLRSG